MPRRFALSVDLNLKEHHEGFIALSRCPPCFGQPSRASHSSSSPSPSSSGGNAAVPTKNHAAALTAKRKQKAMAIAMKPGSQVAMNALMMYMSGSNLNIFSINTVSTAILTPLTSIFLLDRTFGSLEVDTSTAKVIYVAINLVWLGMGLYKMSAMRLLPTTSADFADSIVWKDMMETSSIPSVVA
mmetsp:Transcript_19117/g.44300  ORF Transcript_19117/g.44300 Transcript_19117/m.44300 type:complete len:185 (-) Transcript_19117:38-592(-)|eukprot:CAMPEP_0172392220 /NCGR_PEP_ID=MMETSP1061-20121228/8416_1 /TAXON_ID=37318 /ORGANISM="Pseudo-nitzschia pungens, Strain cf. pungens" /LENGTH=184 /DNA_ID=CAMNT_0013123017 /DNA_START=150 /DNA_END=704 /DNA_ORIENTATION=-